MLGLLAFVKTPDAQVRLDLDNELEEAFFATKEQVKSMLCSQNDQQSHGVVRHGHPVTVPGPEALAHELLSWWAQSSHHVEVHSRL